MSQATPIQLRLIYAGNRVHNKIWAISSDTSHLPPLKLPLPVGCEGDVELYWLRNAWVLRNQSHDLRIFINRIALGPQLFFTINIGDCIDVGNSRFRVERRDQTMLALARNIDEQQATKEQTLLSRISPDPQGIDDSPFDLIPAVALSVLPNDPPEPTPSTPKNHSDDPWPKDNTQAQDDELKRLEQAYFEALDDPHARLNMAYQHATTSGQRFAPPQDSGEALNIETLVCGDVDIDTLMQQINAVPDLNVVHNTEKIDVLRLFSGEHPTSDDSRLPPRTRQDHHLMSLHSEYRLSA